MSYYDNSEYKSASSLKDLGKKVFAFSKLEDDNLELLSKVKTIIEGNKKI